MASITSLSNSNYNTSSIYGNRNVLSGLASGMDTESMIENAVSGLKLKIQNLQKRRTRIEWQQEAYRSIIDKAASLSTKYTSYSSKTNLMSNSFFTNAVNTTTNGTYKDKVTATGKTSSDIKINAVKQMAKAATYTVSGAATGLGGKLIAAQEGKAPGIESDLFDLSKQLDVSTVSGSMTFKYGGTNGASFDIKFDELEDWDAIEVKDADGNVVEDPSNAQKLAQAIRNKLNEVTYSYTKNGFQETTTADKAIKVEVDPVGGITFSDGLGNGNKVSISAVSDSIEETWGASKGDTGIRRIMVESNGLSKKVDAYEYLAGEQKDGTWTGGKELSVTLNGATKKISMSDVMNNVDLTYDYTGGKSKEEQFADALQGELDKAFGKGKIAAGYEDGRLNLTPAKEGDTLSLNGSAVRALGFEDNNANYINAGKKLSDLMGEGIFADKNKLAAVGEVKQSANGKYSVDEAGNRVSKGDDGNYYRVNSDGEFLYNFEVNGANINVTKDTTLETLMNSINSNAEAGVKVSYSKLTNEFKFTATETGANSKIEFGGLAEEMFGPSATGGSDGANDFTYTKGQDAIMDVEINGKQFENFTRSSNTFDIDGLNITVKGAFNADGANAPDKDGNEYEAVTFNTTTDTDKIIDAIREFVNDYNAMAAELKSAYSTLPAQKSNGAKYDPLTAEQEDQYSESELKAYNEKAKQGILFGDTTLSSMYSKLLNAIQPGGADGQTLREIGIGTSYSDGMTTLSLDEDKLRAALESDPDKVKDAFTKTKEGGSSSDGLMQTLQNTLNTYVKTTGEPKGVLIAKAGSVKAPTSINNNSLKSQMDSIDNQIDRLQDRISDQIDRYTSKFSKLEQLIAEMNSQASALSGLMMGGSGSYY